LFFLSNVKNYIKKNYTFVWFHIIPDLLKDIADILNLMINIPSTDKKRVVIVGCGFAGLTLAKKLRKANYQVVIIDKHNYHQFQPLFYQIASAGLDASSITFPIRKVFQEYNDYYIRKAEVKEINVSESQLNTSLGTNKIRLSCSCSRCDKFVFWIG
jgi:NADPH-dependent 2,4-dienoyl-CoA reductase/sulfur reductase-like enzyme